MASAQVLYSGVVNNGANLHGPFAASTSSGIRRYGSTGGYIAPAFAPAAYAAAPVIAAPAAYAAPYPATYVL